MKVLGVRLDDRINHLHLMCRSQCGESNQGRLPLAAQENPLTKIFVTSDENSFGLKGLINYGLIP